MALTMSEATRLAELTNTALAETTETGRARVIDLGNGWATIAVPSGDAGIRASALARMQHSGPDGRMRCAACARDRQLSHTEDSWCSTAREMAADPRHTCAQAPSALADATTLGVGIGANIGIGHKR